MSGVDYLLLQAAQQAGKRSLTRLASHNRFSNGVNTFECVPLTWLYSYTHVRGAQDYATPACLLSTPHAPLLLLLHSPQMPYIQSSLCKHSKWDHITHRLKRSANSYIASIWLLHVMYLCNACVSECWGATMRTCGWVDPPLPSYHCSRLSPHNTRCVIWVTTRG